MPRERRQQPDHDLHDDDGDDDDDDDDGNGDDDIHQSVSGAKMNVPMPEPQMAMPANCHQIFISDDLHIERNKFLRISTK